MSITLLACTGGATGVSATAASVGVEGDTTGTTGGTPTGQTSDVTASDSMTSAGVTSVSNATGSGSDGSTSQGPLATCSEDPAVCAGWFLAVGAGSWESVDIAGSESLAPETPVRVAFDIESLRLGYVLSDDHVSIMDLQTRQWTRRFARGMVFPQLEGIDVKAAYSVPAVDPAVDDEFIVIATAETLFLYNYEFETELFVYVESRAYTPDWFSTNAPNRADSSAFWLDINNAQGWAQGDPADLCDTMNAMLAHLAVVANQDVYVYEAGSCAAFFPSEPYGSFGPTALPGTPPAALVAAALFNETTGLVFFGEG